MKFPFHTSSAKKLKVNDAPIIIVQTLILQLENLRARRIER
jgi:hypothetical protein